MSDNRYRPGATRRHSDRRSPESPYETYFERPSAPRRDSDRVSDYPADRYRSSRPAPRGGDSFSDPRRSAPDAQTRSDLRDTSVTTTVNMDSGRADRVQAELAKQLILLHEAQFDRGKLMSKKDLVLEGFRQRLATYEKHGGRNAHEPAVVEAWRKHQDHFKQEEDKFEKELAVVEDKIKDAANNYARLLIRSLPVDELKERQFIDAAKLELAKRSEPATTSPIDDRTHKLEKQMAFVLDSQKAQEASCMKLMKENEEQRERLALYEAQAAEVAALKSHQEHLQQQLQVQLKDSRDAEIEILKQEKEALKSQVSAFQTQLAELVERIDSEQAHLSKSLQETTTQLKTSTALPSDSSEQIKAVETQVKALDSQIQEHDKVFSNIDAEEYAETVTKLIKYPDYPELKRLMDSQESEIERLSQGTNGLSGEVASVKLELNRTSKRLTTVENRVDLGFREFSDQVIETCGNAVQGLKDRIEKLETQSEAPTTVEDLQKLRDDHNRMENALGLLRNEVRQAYNAQEMMITALDEQFKNISTLDMANIILDNLKRLPTTLVPLDMQNLHERLVDLESFRQEYIRRSTHFAKDWGDDLQKIIATNRSLAEDDDGLEQPEEPQRVEAMRG
ncbi:hypothetical protein N0V82_009360 [Gnomoniopsis sp. IMI 355080]|nr:hypothetical protein N0V82_009360 [Gnomoniopsis sp. IMI 355080]